MFQRCQQTLRQLTAVPPPWVSKRFALRSGELLRFVCNVLSACFSAGSRLLVVIVQFQRKDTDPQLIGNWCHSITLQYTKHYKTMNNQNCQSNNHLQAKIFRRHVHRICMGLRGAFKSHLRQEKRGVKTQPFSRCWIHRFLRDGRDLFMTTVLDCASTCQTQPMKAVGANAKLDRSWQIEHPAADEVRTSNRIAASRTSVQMCPRVAPHLEALLD